MNMRFLVSVVVLFVVSMALGIVVHGLILGGDYQKLTANLFRTEQDGQAHFAWMLLAHVLIAIGFYTRPLALAFAAYTLATALFGHRYWGLQGMEQYMAMINFYKNVSIIGGLLLLALSGPGRYSVDRK